MQQGDNKGEITRLNMKNSEDEQLPYELYVTTRQPIKLCNAIDNNTSTVIRPSEDQT